MTFSSLLIHTVTVYTVGEGTADRYGDATVSESSVTTPARFDAISGTELLIDRDTRLSEFILYLPATVAINATSEVGFDGKRYRVVGEPRVKDNATGPHHIEADLTLVEG